MPDKKKVEAALERVRQQRAQLAEKAKEACPEKREKLRQSITEKLEAKAEPAPKTAD